MVSRVRSRSISGTREKQNTSTFLCGALRLKIQQEFLEKTQSILISSLKALDPHYIRDFNEMHADLEKKRLQEVERLNEQLLIIVNLLKELKKSVCDEQVMRLDTEVFKQNLMELEIKIASVKEMHEREYLQLCQHECSLWEYVSSAGMCIDEWAKPAPVDAVLSNKPYSVLTPGNYYNESVHAFQKFLREKGGHTGGWEEADHLLYLRLRRKFRNRRALMSRLHQEFPEKSLEELCSHDDWYHEYEKLKEEQKMAITEWRKCRDNIRTPSVTSSSDSAVGRKVPPKPRKPPIRINKTSKEEKKRQIEEWKESKQIEKQLNMMKQEEESKKIAIENERKLVITEQKRAEIARYKDEKLKKHYAEIISKQAQKELQAEERIQQAHRNIKIFRQRDNEIVARQREIQARQEEEKKARDRVLEEIRQTVRIEAERDPQRLLKPTGAWREHTRRNEDDKTKSTPPIPLNLSQVPRLGVPAWRQRNTS